MSASICVSADECECLYHMQFSLKDHPVVSEVTHLGLRAKVHSGFYNAWTAKGLDLQVIGHMQVSCFIVIDLQLTLRSSLAMGIQHFQPFS